MNKEDFFKQFEGLENDIANQSEELEKEERKFKALEQKLQKKIKLDRALKGLIDTPKFRDPGKYDTAYYFVKKIIPAKNNIPGGIHVKDIERTTEPSLYQKCHECTSGNEFPVIMSYEQTEDSPDGDTWEKDAFVVCPEHGLYRIAHSAKGERF